MNKIKFEIVREGAVLPTAATKGSAGYDVYAATDITIPSALKYIPKEIVLEADLKESARINKQYNLKATLVPTGVAAKFDFPVVLNLFSRSSIATKNKLILANSVGVIDADYYPNEIYVPFINLNNYDVIIKKGEPIAQFIFTTVLTTEDDNRLDTERTGGFGSTNG